MANFTESLAEVRRRELEKFKNTLRESAFSESNELTVIQAIQRVDTSRTSLEGIEEMERLWRVEADAYYYGEVTLLDDGVERRLVHQLVHEQFESLRTRIILRVMLATKYAEWESRQNPSSSEYDADDEVTGS